MQKIRIAIIGQPNVGKTMLINALGGTQLKVGNFSGVTVDKTEISFKKDDFKFIVTDLPGAYSLNDFTLEEKITRKFLEFKKYDLLLNVVDSTNLMRNLQLTTELLLHNYKMVIALNMIDEAEKEGSVIDHIQLGKILGKPVVKTSAAKKTGMNELLDAIIKEFKNENTNSKLRFSPSIEEEITKIEAFLREYNFKKKYPYRITAINLIRRDKKTISKLSKHPHWIELQEILKKSDHHIYTHYNSHNLDEIFRDNLIAFAKGATTETLTSVKKTKKTITEKLDYILIHPILGIPIFLFLMWGLFQLTFNVGAVPMELLDKLFSVIIEGVKNLLGNGELASAVGDGALGGVGAVVLFLPNIIILFLGISLLESTGYMSRVAFLLDGFFHRFGLHGKSFIPLVTGFGCTVPAYMAARTLKNKRERLLTLFILGFISCSARLPIYVLFIGTFFSDYNAGNILFIIYISGAAFALIAAKILRSTAFKGEEEPFVMEMPKYRIPTFKLLYHSVMGQALSYLKKAGTFILFASVLVWFASNYPKPETREASPAEALEQSYLGQIGKFTEPFFAPLGFDWKMSVALEAGLAAKEVVVSTLQILYTGSSDDNKQNEQGLMNGLKKQITFPAAIAFIVFVMLYIPCFAASAVFLRESEKTKYLIYLFIFTTATAWIFSFIAFNIAKLL
jgi:ferrous iron transport protein B